MKNWAPCGIALLIVLFVAAPSAWAQGSGIGSERSEHLGSGYGPGLGRANARLGGQPNAQTEPTQPKAFMGYDKAPQDYPPNYWRAMDATKPGWARSAGGGSFHTNGGWIPMGGSGKAS